MNGHPPTGDTDILLGASAEQAARKRAQEIQRARMGILPYRRPQRGKVGYWWRRKWRFKALNPRAYDLRTLGRAMERARAEGRL